MSRINKSSKQLQIDKANATIVIIVAVAAMITAFSLVAVKTLLSQRSYQARVISQQDKALKVAKADITSVAALSMAFTAFNATDTNLIGGNPKGTGSQDGPNSKIVLDALPSQYDFPALVSSLEKLVTSKGLKIVALSGVDDAAQANVASSTRPLPIEMPFQLTVTGPYNSVQDLIVLMERTIRPISIGNMQISGSNTNVTLTISAKTYYQPAKNLNITPKVVK